MISTTLESARRFATLLEAGRAARLTDLLAPGCVYHTGTGLVSGPKQIVETYAAAAAKARRQLDEVTYKSQVEVLSPGVAVVNVLARINHLGDRHLYRYRQRLLVDGRGKIYAIAHEELAEERDKLFAFFQKLFVVW